MNEIKLENKRVGTSLGHQRADDCRDCMRRTTTSVDAEPVVKREHVDCGRPAVRQHDLYTSLSRAKFEGLCFDRFKMTTPVEHVFLRATLDRGAIRDVVPLVVRRGFFWASIF